MDEQNPPLTDEVKTLRAFYAALNRNDIPAFAEILDPQIERVEPDGFPRSGTYRGIAAVTAHFATARKGWAEGSCKPERFVKIGDRIVVSVYVHVRLKDETEWRDGHISDVFTFCDGKVIQFRTFLDEVEALDWARVEIKNE